MTANERRRRAHRTGPSAPGGYPSRPFDLIARAPGPNRPVVLDTALVDEVAASGLRGRGGAAFDTATKLRAVARAAPADSGRERGRGRAGERQGQGAASRNPAAGARRSRRDRVRRRCPRCGRRDRVGRGNELESVGRALAERRGDPVRIRVETVPDGFVTGEETALLNALERGVAKPTVKPPYPFERGLNGAPTLVQNVETLAHIALIGRFGADWFRSAGSADAPGTALVTLGGAVRNRGVFEIELGSTLGDLLDRSGGASEPVAAVLVGGYFGRWVAAADAAGAAPDAASASEQARSSSSPPRRAASQTRARVVRYLADESAGQCGPCVHGLARHRDGVRGARREPATRSRARSSDGLRRCAGAAPAGIPTASRGFVESFLDVFAAELARHARRGRCAASTRGWLPVPGACA